MTIYGIGNPLMDIIIQADDKDLETLSLNKGTMHLIDEDRKKEILGLFDGKDSVNVCGGSAPNTIIALSTFGVEAALSGKIGNDSYGEIYADNLKKLNVNSDLKTGEGLTGNSIVLITPDSERTMNTYLGLCLEYGFEDVDTKLVAESEYIYFTGYMWSTESQKKAVLESIKIAEENGTKIIFDVADPFVVQNNREDFLKLIKEHVHITFANREESKLLFELEDVEACAEKLAEISDIAVVKNGSKGSLVKVKDQEIIKIPVNKVNAIDTTGAGDMYAAGFIYGVCNNYSLEESGICASYLASQIVEESGAQFNETKRAKILASLKDGSWNFTK